MLEQNDNFTESDWSKKAYDHPYSLLFSFYQLKIGSIVAPSESIKFPIPNRLLFRYIDFRSFAFGISNIRRRSIRDIGSSGKKHSGGGNS